MRARVVRRGAVVAERQGVAWWVAAAVGAGLLVAAPVWGQAGSAPVAPRSDSPVLPPSGTDQGGRPRSENPLVDGGGRRPIPDQGVITPPASALGSTTVIKPPATGGMPIIAPPGSAGGDKMVVPK